MITPEICEISRYRFFEHTDRCGLPVDTRMRAGEIVRLHRAAFEEPKFHGLFDGDERRFDDQGVVACILQCLGASEQATGLPQLEEGGILDIKSGFDISWAAVKSGLYVVDELLDSRTTHRRRPPFGVS
nr:hypothetical protein [Halorubrum amylolyticum]